LVFDLLLDAQAASVLGKMEDSVAAVLALDLRDRGRTHQNLDVSKWHSFVSLDGLYGSQWLLAYEAAGHGWLMGRNGADPASDPAWSFMRQQGVRFYHLPTDPAGTVDQLPLGPLPDLAALPEEYAGAGGWAGYFG